MNEIIIEKNFDEYKKAFLTENAKLNLISKNDEQYLYEKHIYDSLAIKLFFKEYNYIPETLLDIGTGGGFPSIPTAIEFPQISVVGVDSIKKKITALNNIASATGIDNIQFIHDRVENLKNMEFDVVASRAVARLNVLIGYAYPLLKRDGFIVFYKSKKANEEIAEAKNLIRKLHLKIMPEITYKLPLDDCFNRRLIILQKLN